ncbi:MAG: carboxypeptidase regulatory-like domain-containing protein [Pyrinomonadaceae bacterium]
MKRDLRFILTSILFVAMFAIGSFAQETTGSLEITTKDDKDAVVPGVAITITSTGTTTGFKRNVTTNDEGSIRVLQVPPGTYSLTSAPVSGFAEKTLTNITVELGRTTAISFPMTIGASAVVEVNLDDVSTIDTTKTTVESTINARTAELLPKGLNFNSVLSTLPGTGQETRSGGFQVDGASGSENTFVIDGQEVTNVLSGTLDAGSNIPFSQVQEVKVKNSGFEAEYGGATGGVVIVSTRGGGNEFHGEMGLGLRSSKMEPIPGQILLIQNSVTQPSWFSNRYFQFNETNPTATISGPILRDRLWFLVGYAPQILTQSRTLNFRVPSGLCGAFPNQFRCHQPVETYNFKQRKEDTLLRLDSQLFNKVSLLGKFSWNPITQTGQNPFPSYASELSSSILDGATLNQRGGRQNSMSIYGSGTYTATDKLIVTGRVGHYFLNQKLGSYGIAPIGSPLVVCASGSLSPREYPTGFGCKKAASGLPNESNGVPLVTKTEFDVTTRDQYEGDATYSFSIGGRHELKGGYALSQIANRVDQGTTDLITLRSGITPPATVGAYSGRSIPRTPSAIGSARLSTFKTRGDVASSNTAIYVQDGWQVTNRLRLNLGFRTEKEDVPSYAAGSPGMNFSFSDKITPRLGAAYALTGDGKTKVTAFYGLFFDRFKLTLPRGSFGGDEFHDVFFEWFPGDTINSFTRELIFGPGGGPIPGGACPLNTVTPVIGRVRCDIDFRVASNSGGPLTEVGGIDPNIKPFTQREITFTFQRELFNLYTFSARYTRKQVTHAIEDAGFPNSEGSEYYIIGNPGEGLHKEQSDFFGVLSPKPQRDYDALEFRFDRRLANDYYFKSSYTWSRLYGNYGGLASSDEEGRTDPNVNRYFDQPHAGFIAATGGPDNGRLATDRPHVFKFEGSYDLGWDRFGLWKNNRTDFGIVQFIQSGTVITSFVNINNISQIVLNGRGDLGRTPTFTQTNMSATHSINFGRDGRFSLKMDADILNLFNQYIVVNRGVNPSGQGGNIINTANFGSLDDRFGLISPAETAACNGSQQCELITSYRNFQLRGSPALVALASDPTSATRNVYYNIDAAYQGKRQIRYGVRFIF